MTICTPRRKHSFLRQDEVMGQPLKAPCVSYVIALQQYLFTGAWQSTPYTRLSLSVGRWVGQRILSQRAVKPVSAYELRAHNNRQAVYSAKVVEFSKFASDTAKHHSKSSQLQLQVGIPSVGSHLRDKVQKCSL